MRHHNFPILSLLLGCTLLLGSCSQGDEPDKSRSVLPIDKTEKNAFDKWLQANYGDAYNLSFYYHMADDHADRDKNLSPATMENSMKMAKILKHGWFAAYEEVAGVDFMRQYGPREIQLIGSRSTTKSGTDLLGTAEGGLRVVLYKVNHLDVSSAAGIVALNDSYFETIHHEFAHILHQHIKWPVEFNQISAGDYLPSNWSSPDYTGIKTYAPLGFVTAYSRCKDSEDVAEVTAAIICWSDEHWQALFAAAGEQGRAKLERKVALMKGYMRDAYHIDMDSLRDVCRRRLKEIQALQFINPEWQSLLSNELRGLLPQTTRWATSSAQHETQTGANLDEHSDWGAIQQTGTGNFCQVYLQHASTNIH